MDKQKNKEITAFVRRVREKFQPEQIILFGSRARGDDWKQSDYDFIIVSSKFRGVHWLKRITESLVLWDLMSDVDILPYTPEEFEEKKRQRCIVQQAVKEGITL